MPQKMQFARLDDGQNVFFGRQTEYVKKKTYDKKYPDLLARTFIPVSYEIPSGASNVVYYQYDEVGMAAIVADNSNTLPRVDVIGREFTGKIRSIGDAYGYTLQEIRTAMWAGMNLDTRKAAAAKRAAYQLEDEIAVNGDDRYGLVGLLSHPNIPDVALPADGSGASALWSAKTYDLIIRDIDLLVMQIVDGTKNVERPDTLLVPLAARNRMATLKVPDSGQSVLQWYLANSPYIKQIEVWPALKGKGAGGTDIMVAYRKDPEILELQVPQEFEQLPVQEDGLEFVTNCHMRTGGVSVYYPLAIAKADGF